MKRYLMTQLMDWKQSPHRKPLILNGIRQCGKTWLLKEFGKQCYENTAYFSFDETVELRSFFETTRDPKRILPNLEFLTGHPILPGQTLIIFDEIQECPEALHSLKYFCENAPDYHVACAGSLLGIALSQSASFPVGKVDFLNLYPMSFSEFLEAGGDERLAEYMQNQTELKPLPELVANPLMEKLRLYFVTGGMPEVVRLWAQEQDSSAMDTALSNILTAYERDFAKHPERKEYPKISMIWQSIPSQLSRENKKFLYKVVKEGARAREYEFALQWLVDAGLFYKIFRMTAPGLPVSAFDDLSAFKIYLADVGLLRKLSRLSPVAIAEGDRLFTIFKGALTENYVLQALIPQLDVIPRYWSQSNPPHEVDFVIQRENDIIPIEVKSGQSVKSKSLKIFSEKYSKTISLRVRFSMDPLTLDGNLLNIPLYLADQTDRLIGLALTK